MSTSPVPSSVLSTFLSVSNTGRKGQTWNLMPSLHDSHVYTSGTPAPILPLSMWMGCLLWLWGLLMNIYHLSFFFFVYPLSHSVSMLGTFMQYVSYNKRPRQAEAPTRLGMQRWGSRGAETVGTVFQAQSRYSSWGSEGPQCRGASWSPGQHDAAPRLC